MDGIILEVIQSNFKKKRLTMAQNSIHRPVLSYLNIEFKVISFILIDFQGSIRDI